MIYVHKRFYFLIIIPQDEEFYFIYFIIFLNLPSIIFIHSLYLILLVNIWGLK